MEETLTITQDHDYAPCKPDNSLAGTPSPFICTGMPFAAMLSSPCPFSSEAFLDVMLHLIKNPNITSSHLFRADIFYDSLNDATFDLDSSGPDLTARAKHMKAEYRPLQIDAEGYGRDRLIVRQMVPRNPQLDKPLVQTCHFLSLDCQEEGVEKTLIILLPHASSAEEIPWYHPTVRGIAFLHTWRSSITTECSPEGGPTQEQGNLSLHISLFPASAPEPTRRLTRTLHKLLQITHKHGLGYLRGYQKRVHHDRLIPQRDFQDTYARLKAKHAKQLIGEWAEQTDPAKHVFEDLAIAAFCIELWCRMYASQPSTKASETMEENSSQNNYGDKKDTASKFPGFLDIGCGNGVLVYILLSEGYKGWGFDAKRRKTWETFPTEVQQSLKQMVLVPSVLSSAADPTADTTEPACLVLPSHSSPDLVPSGTFIISNHADELTLWTPLLAYLTRSPFLCIPCCSHDLSGARFRAPAPKPAASQEPRPHTAATTEAAAKTKPKSPPPPSAYACLTACVTRLATELGYAAEREMLRIPSTRNACIVGRDAAVEGVEDGDREGTVRMLVVKETGRTVEVVGREWMERVWALAKGNGKGH